MVTNFNQLELLTLAQTYFKHVEAMLVALVVTIDSQKMAGHGYSQWHWSDRWSTSVGFGSKTCLRSGMDHWGSRFRGDAK